ncbi:MAG TPA: PhzF family phenazine biosynthesis protein [Acidimicrobiales bacterium]|jgi:trans-2,3-dihydro-3-hydroxyanthranilate isomerase|nr:PhzF family phenazine biosynthesis protein [Acidimicrobiales bacterium]
MSSKLFSDGPGEAGGGTLTYTVLDVFAATPLQGNPLAVFLDGRDLTSNEMQALALEMKLSESVFLLPPEADGDVRMRIFTPAQELPFAGHPVLGTAFAVADRLGTNSVTLETGLGPIAVDLTREGYRLVFGRMSQPIPTAAPFEPADELLEVLGVQGSELPVEAYDNGPRHVFVALASAEAVARLRPNLHLLKDFGAIGVNCFALDGDHWKTRMFAPAMGVDEDPATGSAAGPLAVHLARHGRIAFGEEIVIHQGAEIYRPSVLHASVHGTADEITRVEVGGAAVVVAQGQYLARSYRAS